MEIHIIQQRPYVAMINLKVPGMWVTVGYQSLFELSKIDTNSPFEVHIKSDAVKVGEAVIQFLPLNASNKYVLDDSYSLYRGDAVFIDKK